MGVLDDIKAGLSSPVTQVVETHLVPGGSLDKIRERLASLAKGEALAAYSDMANIQMPDLSRPAPVNDITRRPQDFVGPKKPPVPVEAPEPALGQGGQIIADTLAKTVDDIRRAFTRENPILGPAIEEYQKGGMPALLNAIPQAITGGVAGLGAFIGGTVAWATAAIPKVMAGENVLDAFHNARSEGDRVTEAMSQRDLSPIAGAMVGAAASPFSAFSEILRQVTSSITDDPRVDSTVQLLGQLAILGGGEAAIKYFEGLKAGKIKFEPKVLVDMATKGVPGPEAKVAAKAVLDVLDPMVKADRAREAIASKMDDQTLIRQHAEARFAAAAPGTENPQAAIEWRGSLGREIVKRNLEPMMLPELDQLARPEASGNFQSVAQGLTPMYTDPKMYWYLKGKGLVPEGVEPPAGSEPYRPNRWRTPGPVPKEVARTYTEYKPGQEYGQGTPVDLTVPTISGEDVRLRSLPEGAAKGAETRTMATRIGQDGLPEQYIKITRSLPEPTLSSKRPHMTRRGYWRVPAPIGHPGADTNGMISYHRMVLEDKLGRYLNPEEVAHHKDLTTANNEPGNLFAFQDRKSHTDYHNSPQAAEPRAQLESEAMDKAQPYITYVEHTNTGEFGPTTNEKAGPYDVVLKQYSDGRRELLDYGDKVPPAVIERASGGKVQAAPVAGGEAIPTSFMERAQPMIEVARKSHIDNEGSTVSLAKGDMGGQDLWAVSPFPELTDKVPGRDIPPGRLESFVQRHQDILESNPDLGVETWWDKSEGPGGTTYIDISATLPHDEAQYLGRVYNQKGITHLTDFSFESTGGDGTVLKDAGWLPFADRLSDVKLQQMRGAGEPPVSGGAAGAPPGVTSAPSPTELKQPGPVGDLPAQKRIPDEGTYIAIRTDDDGLYFAKESEVASHAQLVTEQGIPPERVVGGGFIRDGVYHESPRSEAVALGDLARVNRWRKANPDPVASSLESLMNPGGTVTTNATPGAAPRSERLVTQLLDKFYPIHKYAKQAGKILSGANPSLLVKTLAGSAGKAYTRVFRGGFTSDVYGQNTPNGQPSLIDIYTPHTGDMEGFDQYLIYRSAREEEMLNKGRDPKDWVHTGVDINDTNDLKWWADRDKYESSAKLYTQYMHSLLNEMSKEGILDQETSAAWKWKRPDYAPLRRDLEGIADVLDRSAGGGNVRKALDRVMSPIKERKGSDLPILPPTQAAVLMTYEIQNALDRHAVAQAIVDLRNTNPDLAKVIAKIEPGMGTPEGPDLVTVLENGKPAYYRVPLDLAQSMKSLHEAGLGKWVRRMSVPARILRTGATTALEFAMRNPIRDTQTAFVNAIKGGYNPIPDFFSGFWSMVTKDDTYWAWKRSGAEWSMLVTLDRALGEEAIKEMHKETDVGMARFVDRFIKSPLGYLEAISEAGEKPTRIGVFKRAKQSGLSDLEAAVESREASTDFATRGSETAAVSSMYTFLNARAQTTYKLFRTAVEHPAQFAIKGAAIAALPSIALYALNRNDPEYWKRSELERDTFWFLPLKVGGRQVKFPKGEMGIIFGTAIEKILEALDSKSETRPKLEAYFADLFQTLSPVGNKGELLPVFARPITEWAVNQSFYYGTPIENETDKAAAPYLRYGPQTSETMKSIGQGLGALNNQRGVSPKMLENTLRGYTGGVGRLALKAADLAGGVTGAIPQNPKPEDVVSIPGVGGFMSRKAVGFESQPAQDFYDTISAISETKNTLDRLIKQGGERGPEVLAWTNAHPTEMRLQNLAKLWTDAQEKLSAYRKMEQSIAGNRDLNGSQKKKMLDEIDKMVSAIVDPLWTLQKGASK